MLDNIATGLSQINCDAVMSQACGIKSVLCMYTRLANVFKLSRESPVIICLYTQYSSSFFVIFFFLRILALYLHQNRVKNY